MASAARSRSSSAPTWGSVTTAWPVSNEMAPFLGALPNSASRASSASSSRLVVDRDDRIEVLAAGVVVPEPLRVPAPLAARGADRGLVVDRQAEVLRRHLAAVTADGHGDRRSGAVGQPGLERLGRRRGRLPADRDAGHGGAARDLVAGGGVRRDVPPGQEQHQQQQHEQDEPAALALLLGLRRLQCVARTAGEAARRSPATPVTRHILGTCPWAGQGGDRDDGTPATPTPSSSVAAARCQGPGSRPRRGASWPAPAQPRTPGRTAAGSTSRAAARARSRPPPPRRARGSTSAGAPRPRRPR